MSEIKWIKITTDIFDDEKILLIESMPDADAIIVIWFKLLVLAGKTNNCGLLTINDTIPYNDEMLATIFRRPLNTVRLALKVFEDFGMIDIINDTIAIPKWGKHQNVEGIEKVREQTRERVARYRQKQKLLEDTSSSEQDVTLHNVTVTEQNKNKNKNKNKNLHTDASLRPSIEDVEAYVKEKNLSVDAQKFFDYFEASEWVDSMGKPVRNWKQKLITWSKNGTYNGTMSQSYSTASRGNGNSGSGNEESPEDGYDWFYVPGMESTT